MMLNAIIVDDEPLARSLLAAILADIPDLKIVAECKNGFEAIEAVVAHTPDVTNGYFTQNYFYDSLCRICCRGFSCAGSQLRFKAIGRRQNPRECRALLEIMIKLPF